MQGRSGHAENQVTVAPGDLIEAYDHRRLVIASHRVVGLVGVNAWETVCLSDGGHLTKLVLHDETQYKTWAPVKPGRALD